MQAHLGSSLFFFEILFLNSVNLKVSLHKGVAFVRFANIPIRLESLSVPGVGGNEWQVLLTGLKVVLGLVVHESLQVL